MEKVSNTQVLARIAAELGDWRKLAQHIAARYRAADAVAAAAFAAAIARYDVPEIRLGREVVDVALFSVDVDVDGGRWLTAEDLDAAGVISGLARESGLVAAPGEVTQLELGLDTADDTIAGPFWAALLTGDAANTVFDSVFDPSNRVPAVWFQRTDAHDTPRQRWHLDLWLAPESAPDRITAALAAGGTLIDTSEAPAFTVLADPEGNKVCVCTALARS